MRLEALCALTPRNMPRITKSAPKVPHEMIHAAVDTPDRLQGQGVRFWTELEWLIASGAPVTAVRFPELGERGSDIGIIPRRFRRCRQRVRSATERDRRMLARRLEQATIQESLTTRWKRLA